MCFWIAAVVPGVIHNWSLRWPYDPDGFRDVAIAQTMRDGHWTSDPLYANETAWYSPLIPAALSLASLVLDLPVPEAYARLGPWLNSLGALAFYVCSRRIIGPWPAAVALCAFLFLPGRPPAWASGTYSPWLFPAVATQALFFGGLVVWVHARELPTMKRAVATGVLLGLTFLAHAGSGIVLAGIIALSVVTEGRRHDALARVRYASIVFLIAVVVALPFILPIASQYRFRVMNRGPATWPHEPAHLWPVLRSWMRPGAVIELAVMALGALSLRRSVAPRAQTVLASWGAAAGSLYIYSLIAEDWSAVPAIVPAYHFVFILRPLTWMLFGLGFVEVARLLTEQATKRVPRNLPLSRALFYLTLLFGIAVYPRYLGREAFTMAPQASREFDRSPGRLAYEWIRRNTSPSAVFLSSDIDALTVVGPAGRHVVCVDRYFSNPYVEYFPRALARDDMLAALQAGDRDRFESLRGDFRVTYVLARGEQALSIRQNSQHTIERVFVSEPITIFKVIEGR